MKPTILLAAATFVPSLVHAQEDVDALRDKVAALEKELDQARRELAAATEKENNPPPKAFSSKETTPLPVPLRIPADSSFSIGKLQIGGAIRANYVLGSYQEDGLPGPQRGGNGGNFELDTFRTNFDYNKAGTGFTAKAEYRFYNGYHFPHTAWAGWRNEDDSIIRVGLNRVPFGAGAYGTSHNWFFDLGYYVGLTDDMDMGVSYTTSCGDWQIDLAYYLGAEPNFFGDSSDSGRYSYDIIDNGSAHSHYRERHQINLRAIRTFTFEEDNTLALGASFQAGLLEADKRYAHDSHQLAAAIHAKWNRGPWEVISQLSAWDYAADYRSSSGLSNDLIGMGAYDYEAPVASRALLPALGIAYKWETDHIDWLDYITFYNDFSVILKDGHDPAGSKLKNSAMNVLGMSFTRGNWHIYCDWAYSNGNLFVGDDPLTDFGANEEQEWQSRFNINFGYYF
ncbi:hypothetical protein SAMN02745181_3824 [Rubritalea squalenifaciens DSM 18772]|uniref:Phosphate-selective porin O and P n=1 Tax=Rubritalea squalenifaciens DSM 18772 TaxID=1123071 RepID=A0A1M6SHB4_9BACT|nr:carbohydrate porin [Rubritalea squalenifaciens]SHK44040.1 hypothetical protein SAMN02745181_3824 [Rubritalea squalenifaciens DSM 18772]